MSEENTYKGLMRTCCEGEEPEIVWVRGLSANFNDEYTPPHERVYVCEIVNTSESCLRRQDTLLPLESGEDWRVYNIDMAKYSISKGRQIVRDAVKKLRLHKNKKD